MTTEITTIRITNLLHAALQPALQRLGILCPKWGGVVMASRFVRHALRRADTADVPGAVARCCTHGDRQERDTLVC